MTATRTKHKTMKAALESNRIGDIVNLHRVGFGHDEVVYTVEHIEGIGRDSYPVSKFSYVKEHLFFGYVRVYRVYEECLDVALSCEKACAVMAHASGLTDNHG